MTEEATLHVRNARWDASGTITLELDHPTFGWIPFTASPDDSEELGRQLYAAGVAGEYPVAPLVGADAEEAETDA